MIHHNNLWVSKPKPRPAAQVSLFCFPFAGGGAAYYYPWTKQLPPEIELVQVLLPGREARLRESPYTDLIALVEKMVSMLVPIGDRPFIFFGHSMGALIAFEISRCLRRQGKPLPEHLFISGCRAPHLPDKEDSLSNLDTNKFVEKLRKYEGTPEVIFQNQELLDIFLPVLRADFALFENYQFVADIPLEIPITAFGGLSDPRTAPEEIEAWRTHTNYRFNSHFFSGGHFFISHHRSVLLDIIANSWCNGDS